MNVVRFKLTPEIRVCLGLTDVMRYRGPYHVCSDAESASVK